MARYILGIDEGTSSTRACLLNSEGKLLGKCASKKITQIFPQPSWVEHHPNEIWEHTLEVCRATIKQNNVNIEELVGIAITNQRETTIIWDRTTGLPIYNAIVWQDRRGAGLCEQLASHQEMVSTKTGLILDSYFCATKIKWILENVADASEKAKQGKLAFGTIDCFLLWKLTNGKVHATDITNASRTLLFNIHTLTWDKELLDLFNIPSAILPQVYDCTANYGVSAKDFFGKEIPICAIAGDQHAALFGQACFETGMAKSTFGTGCFMMLNTGALAQKSSNKLLTTIGFRINSQTTYAIEGSIFMAGAIMQWVSENLGILENINDSARIASELKDTNGVYLVPAFTGLAAPHWKPHAKAIITGLTRDSNKNHIIRAALEAIAYQAYDLIKALTQDAHQPITQLRIDGGLCHNLWFNQFLADLIDIPVAPALVQDTTIFGVSLMAGLQTGLFNSVDEIKSFWHSEKTFSAKISNHSRQQYLNGWQDALNFILK
jgi:glycerol kinase